MERTKDINADPRIRKAIILIILFHLVGLIGFFVPLLRPLFILLVPWHLLIMLVIIGYSHRKISQRFWVFAAVIFIAGFAVEWVGVHKAWLFGNYFYGDTLGIKVDNVPLTIGVNWFLLIYSTGILMQYSRIKYVLIRITLGAGLLVLLDKLIEPVATRFDYWHWEGNIIPNKNYICWFAISVVMLLVFENFRFRRQSVVGVVLLATQFAFFAALHFCK